MLGSDFLHHQRDGGRNAQYSVVYLCESSTAVSVETAEVDLARSCFLFHLKSLECAFQALGVTRTVSNQHKKTPASPCIKGSTLAVSRETAGVLRLPMPLDYCVF